MSPKGERRVSEVFNISRMRPSGHSHGHSWPVFRDSETLMARPSRMLGVQFPFGYRRICWNHAWNCVMLVFWHFLAWGRISVGLLRNLGTEENGTRNFPYVFYAILSDVRWNIKRARRNFQVQPNEKLNHTSIQLSPDYPSLLSVRPALSS